MDKKDGGTIDLEALRGFTPGPWFANGRYIGTAKHMSAIGECRDVNGNWCDDVKSSADAQLIAAAPSMHAELTDRRARDAEVEALVAAQRASIDEIERMRDAMFRVYATAANGGNVTPWIEKMRDEMDKPWSVDRSREALAPFTGAKP